MKNQLIKLIPVAAVALILAACGRNPKDPGRIYMPDMTYPNSYKAYMPSEIKTPEGVEMSARQPVPGTIPYGYIPDDPAVKQNASFLMSYVIKNHYTHSAEKWQEEFERAGKEIKDPLPYSDENKSEGSRLYNINCTPCHGAAGEGNGQLVELPGGGDGPFTSRPPSYKTRLPQVNDGNIFYVVSYGKNMMGGYGFQLTVKERWQVIHYIKSLAGINGDDNGPAGAAPAKAEPAAAKKKGKA
jgi:mono/diheme cytochrome c family protein